MAATSFHAAFAVRACDGRRLVFPIALLLIQQKQHWSSRLAYLAQFRQDLSSHAYRRDNNDGVSHYLAPSRSKSTVSGRSDKLVETYGDRPWLQIGNFGPNSLVKHWNKLEMDSVLELCELYQIKSHGPRNL
jgi:hypothetical protein